MKWEYRVFLQTSVADLFDVNTIGGNGWELMAVIVLPDREPRTHAPLYAFYFKRPLAIPPAATKENP